MLVAAGSVPLAGGADEKERFQLFHQKSNIIGSETYKSADFIFPNLFAMKSILFSLLLLLSILVHGQRSIDSKWELVFSDEFTKGVDQSLWGSNMPWGNGIHGVYGIADSIFAPRWAYHTNDFRNVIPTEDSSAIILRSQREPSLFTGQIIYDDTCTFCEANYNGDPSSWVTNHWAGNPAKNFNDTTLGYKTAEGEWKLMYTPSRQFTHTTGMLYSKQLFRYGYFEMRFKIPAGGEDKPVSPSFWLWYGAAGETEYNEIDIAEISAYHNNYCGPNIHLRMKDQPDSLMYHGANERRKAKEIHLDSSWHVASCLWTKRRIEIRVDGVVQKVYRKPARLLETMGIVIDVAYPAYNYLTGRTSIDEVPEVYDFTIDYVRVYQRRNKKGFPGGKPFVPRAGLEPARP